VTFRLERLAQHLETPPLVLTDGALVGAAGL